MPVLPTALLRWTASDAVVADDEHILHYDGDLTLRPGMSETTITFPPQTAPQPFAEAVASWQGTAPAQTAMEVALRVMIGERWTRWWTMGIWSADTSRRRSVEDQHDEDGHVSTDTLKLRQPATAVQCCVTLRSDDSEQVPTLRGIAVMTTPEMRQPMVDLPSAVIPLDVPSISQMELEGGEVWCSPVALTMVLQYWHARLNEWRLAPFLAPDASSRLTVPSVYDPVYDGTGNWPFNTAFASSFGLQAYVARFDTLADIVPWLEAGIPVIASISWEPGKLDNAPVAHSGGHLVVVVGFTTCGDVIVNDPAGLTSGEIPVRRTYRRDQFKQAWQRKGRGTVYLIYPPGME